MAAEWILEKHRVPLELCNSLYGTPVISLEDWFEVAEYTSGVRVRVWKNEDGYFVGCKGTSQLIDLQDDVLVATLRSIGAGDVTLLDETNAIVEQLLEVSDPGNILVGGHSLGGWVALKSAEMNPGVYSVSFNGAAPPTNPVTSGPGPTFGTHYHIAGDIISSNTDPGTANIVRVDKGFGFGSLIPHGISRFYADDSFSVKGALTANEENRRFQRWAAGLFFNWRRLFPAVAATSIIPAFAIYTMAWRNPIK